MTRRLPWRRKLGQYTDPRRRFWFYVRVTRGDDPCWIWVGSSFGWGTGHHGQFVVRDGEKYIAHRYAWQLEHGPVPDGLVLDHLCGVTLCVRPSHLEPVTVAVNSSRGRSDSWAPEEPLLRPWRHLEPITDGQQLVLSLEVRG